MGTDVSPGAGPGPASGAAPGGAGTGGDGDGGGGWGGAVVAFLRGRLASQLTLPRRIRRHRTSEVALFAALALVVIFSQSGSDYSTSIVVRWLYLAIAVVGFWITFGMAGQFAFCQAAFVGMGAYTAARVTVSGGPFPLAVLASVVVVCGVALVFFVLVSRANYFYFAIATLGVTEIFLTMVNKWTWFGGPTGFRSGIPKPSLFGLELTSERDIALLMLAGLCIALVGAVLIERSPLYRNAITQRDQYEAAPLFGIPVLRTRMTAFVVGSGYAGVAGALFASWQGFLSPESFGVDLSLGIFVMLILGGMGSMWGGVIGAAFYVLLPESLRSLTSYKELVYGVLLLVVIIVLPDGIVGLVGRLREGVATVQRRRQRRRRPVAGP